MTFWKGLDDVIPNCHCLIEGTPWLLRFWWEIALAHQIRHQNPNRQKQTNHSDPKDLSDPRSRGAGGCAFSLRIGGVLFSPPNEEQWRVHLSTICREQRQQDQALHSSLTDSFGWYDDNDASRENKRDAEFERLYRDDVESYLFDKTVEAYPSYLLIVIVITRERTGPPRRLPTD